MKLESVADAFATYHSDVIPPGASELQIEECRRAFYAGAYFLLMSLAVGIGDDSTSEEDGIVELEKLKAECEAFFANLLSPNYTFPDAPAAPALKSSLPAQPDISYTTADPDAIKPILQDLGGRIGAALPDRYGFVLLLFTYATGNVFYISSAERADVITMLREFIKRQTS